MADAREQVARQIVLSLSTEEAEMLWAVLGVVGGSHFNSPMQSVIAVRAALSDFVDGTSVCLLAEDGRVYFEDYYDHR